MGMFDRFLKTEERALENPNAPVSANDFLHIMGWDDRRFMFDCTQRWGWQPKTKIHFIC